MNIAGVIITAVLLAIPAVIIYAIKPKKGKNSGCGSHHSDCSSYSTFSNLYEGCKEDQEQK